MLVYQRVDLLILLCLELVLEILGSKPAIQALEILVSKALFEDLKGLDLPSKPTIISMDWFQGKFAGKPHI